MTVAQSQFLSSEPARLDRFGTPKSVDRKVQDQTDNRDVQRTVAALNENTGQTNYAAGSANDQFSVRATTPGMSIEAMQKAHIESTRILQDQTLIVAVGGDKSRAEMGREWSKAPDVSQEDREAAEEAGLSSAA